MTRFDDLERLGLIQVDDFWHWLHLVWNSELYYLTIFPSKFPLKYLSLNIESLFVRSIRQSWSFMRKLLFLGLLHAQSFALSHY